MGDCSGDSSAGLDGGVQPGSGEGGREVEEQGQMDSVLLFDEKTDSFQLYKEDEGEVTGHL